jgi:hypothetical protein
MGKKLKFEEIAPFSLFLPLLSCSLFFLSLGCYLKIITTGSLVSTGSMFQSGCVTHDDGKLSAFFGGIGVEKRIRPGKNKKMKKKIRDFFCLC